ncbi:MAG: glutamine amidotransferase [Leptolyngbya sp. SIO4C1]|nr:glutamine amidotransferase [Leptolyngbya sp. SIO4C1]
MASSRILTVVHQATSTAGLVGQQLSAQGYGLDLCCPALGQTLPANLEQYAGVIIFGGPMSANDGAALPFIRDELIWLEAVLTAELPYLGICLGAQLLAKALGAAVSPHPSALREIGYYSIQATAAGAALFPTRMQVYHWHKEGFTLPADAVLLATGETFTNQAFCYRDRAYGLQFHPEITPAMIDHWTTNAADQLVLPGAQPRSAHFDQHQQYGSAVADWLGQFLQHWLSPRRSPTSRVV